MMRTLYVALILSIAVPAAAGVFEAWPGSEVLSHAAGIIRSAREIAPSLPKLLPAQENEEQVFILRGNANGSFVSLRVDRANGHLRGNLNGDYVSLSFDRGQGILRGNANGSYWSLRIEKIEEGYLIRGNANNSYVSLQIDPVEGTIRGNANGAYVSLAYDAPSRSLRGNANGAYVSLRHEEGGLRGNADGSYVSLEVDSSAGTVRGNANGAYMNLALQAEGGGEAEASALLTFSVSSVIDGLLLRLPTNLFGF